MAGDGPSRLLDNGVANVVDGLLEASVVGSFSRVGYLVRRATEHWEDPPRVPGKVVVVTGGSSGVGRACALALGRLGAEVWVLGRDAGRTDAVAQAIRADGGRAEVALVDMADGAAIDAFAARLGSAHDRVDALVHAAGALLRDYRVSADGVELTVATHVLGPFRLTWELAPLLQRAGKSTIVTVSSGGMYTERFDLAHLEKPPTRYDGVRAYARAKRAQVVLAGEWARRWGAQGVASYAMHPGWVDTPGLASGLPSFGRLGPLLRRPSEGADTAVWLATGAARPRTGGFWHDRHRRSAYYLPWTRPRDVHPQEGAGSVGTGVLDAEEEQGRALWDWCATRTGLGLER